MKTNYHTHTTRCHHATGSDEEFVLSAIKGGYQELGFSDHTPWKYHTDYISDIRMLPEELPGYVESIRSLQEYKLDYIIFGNHHFHTDEKFPYFGRNTDSVDMLELYEESAIEGMESGLFAYLAHPDLFMRSYPEFDRHCKLVSRHICRTAVRLNLPLEYNIGYEEYNDIHGITTIPHPDFRKIAAHEGCTAIIGVDAHNNQYLENPFYYNRATETLRKLGIKVTDRISFFNEK